MSARLKIDGKMKSIGLFPTRAEAEEACRAYRVIYPVKRVRKPAPSRAKPIPVRKTKECVQVPVVKKSLTTQPRVFLELGPKGMAIKFVDPSGAAKWREALARIS